MKKYLFTLLAAAFSLLAAAQDQAPAFPGAEGHGRYVTGGRGGSIIHVTTLADSGEGSLRNAVSGSSKKTIVFDVAGVIELKSDLKIGANTTIAGQTAPAPGITLRYYTVRPDAGNVIIRFIRFRRGEEKDKDDGADAIWTRQQTGMILDHCSFSWSIDEVASFYDNNNYTMQWCTIAESLNNAGHGKGAHGYGGIWGGKLASFHHNMILHVTNRAPRFCGARYDWNGYTQNKLYSEYKWKNSIQAENVDMRNCVMFNWGDGNGCYGGTGGGQINIVNNYYKAGPATKNKTRVTQISVATSSNASGSPFMGYTCRYYINGNYVTAASNPANYDWSGVIYDSGTYTIDGEHYCTDANHRYGDNVTYVKNSGGTDCVKIKMDTPTAIGDITTHTAEKSFEKVTAYAGASLYRDVVDERYATEAKSGTATYKGSVTKVAGMIDRVADQGGYTLESTSRPEDFDADKDGIADAWEQANGGDLDPNAYTIDADKKWYTNLEVYLNSLVEDIMKAGNADGESNYTEYYPAYKKPTGISTVRTSAIAETEYYDLNGRRLTEPQHGVNIRVERMSNGQTVTSKVIR